MFACFESLALFIVVGIAIVRVVQLLLLRQSLKLVHVVLAFLSSSIFELVIGPLLPSVVVQFDLWGLGLVCTLPRTASWISRAAEEVQLAFLRRYKMRASKAHKPQGQLRDFLLELLKHLQTEMI